MAVELDIQYTGHLHCSVKHGPSNQTFSTDAPTDNGGQGAAISPTDLVGAALGSCIMTIMGLVAKRHGADLSNMHTRVVKEMTQTPPRRIESLRLTVTIPEGKNLSAEDRKTLENAARLCPVKQSIHPDVDVRLEFVYPD